MQAKKQQKRTLRIGNAGGYWGDDPHALERQVFKGDPLDYISIDFLAEITMSIMQKQRQKEASLGYARDFISMLEPVLGKIIEQKTTIITNAGGINPEACAEAVLQMASRLGLKPKIALVAGDDIFHHITELEQCGANFNNMETGEDFALVRSRLRAANVYLGAQAVVEALKFDPDIVITGRVTDTGITLAPMIYHFNWALNDWDKLAAGIVAGHILECGAQSTGGNFTDWHKVPSFHEIGYPIVEVSSDGTFVVTKHPDTGGLVSRDTVREQLVYEMGCPTAYITPDVVADFSTIQITDDGVNRVKIYGIRGYEPTDSYKVSMAYEDGFKAVGSILISGPQARQKAEAFAKIFWDRVDPQQFLATETEYLGWNACHRSLGHVDDGAEILLRLGARSLDEKSLRVFGKMIPSLILSGPPGVAVTGGVPRIQEVISYWPALMPKDLVKPRVCIYRGQGEPLSWQEVSSTVSGHFKEEEVPSKIQIAENVSCSIDQALIDEGVALSKICLGRSGDKGDTCNIGVLARSEEAYQFLEGYLTAQRVKDWFQELCYGRVVRYSLENLHGFNFLLEQSLGGGGTKTMRIDAQGKTFAQALLRQKALIPPDVLKSCQDL